MQDGSVNQGAVNRLTAAGVSVPASGIGNGSIHGSAQGQEQSTAPAATNATGPSTSQLYELQSRFSKFSTKSPPPESPNQGTSMAQKQAAFNTAQAFRNDPSSVSMSDARNTAATANNFRERHGEQVASGWKSANAFNKKYDVANKVNTYSSPSTGSPQVETPQSPLSFEGSSTSTVALHKRPPPPPPQKPGLSHASSTSPPPVPLSSKPRS